MQGGVLLHDILQHRILERVEEMVPLVFVHLLDAQGVKHWGDVLLLHHKRDEEILVGQFFFVGVRHEAVQHIVVLHRRVRTDGLEAAVVVGKHKPVRTHDHTRAVAAEVHDAVLNGIIALIQSAIRQLVVLLLHRLIDGIRQVIQCPHTLVGLGREGEQGNQGC